MNPGVELHIDELILHGFSVHDRNAIAEAVQSEMTRLFTEQGIPSSLAQQRTIPSLKAGSFNFQQPADAENLGNNIANSVYNEFTNGK